MNYEEKFRVKPGSRIRLRNQGTAYIILFFFWRVREQAR